ncbi:MAG: ATP-dependent helicase [Verrucomicrobiota bacterium]
MTRQYTLHPRPVATLRIDYAAELNPQQLAAVQAPDGPALVIAGAGSGKTRTLTYRVAYLLEKGVSPSNILLLTFTNKAAREMLERVEALLPDRTAGLWGGTFHSVGNRILRRHAEAAGFRSGFSIMDREDQEDLLESVIASSGVNPKDKSFPKSAVVGDILSYALNTGKSIEAVLDEKYDYFMSYLEQIAGMRSRYEARKKSANVVDFDDLLEKPLKLLEANEEIARYYQEQFQYILVDEYQDTNQIQAAFIDVLARKHRNVMVVGDDAQSIYSWRGANFQNILQFPKRYRGATVYKIETNYRSIPEVLNLANAAIAANTEQFPKELQAFRENSGVKPALVPLENSNIQARFVAQRIQELHDDGIDLREIAVLYRAHFHSMELQMELTRQGVPFAITSGLRFFEQAHIKDVATFLKFVVNPFDEVAFKRMVRLLPGVGARSAGQLWQAVEKSVQAGAERSADNDGRTPIVPSYCDLLLPLKVPAKSRKAWEQLAYTLDEIAPGGDPVPPAKAIESIIEAVYDEYMRAKFPNYDARREDLNTLSNYGGQFLDVASFLDQLALMSSVDNELGEPEDEQGNVTLSSVHQAKGLEWRVVFVIWMCDGSFPSGRSLESPSAIEEERRLFYVAVTRAKDALYLTYPLMRSNASYGDMVQRQSRFLEEIPKARLEHWQVG